jgi:t-SNARE complex subunit (syntaxin)
MCPVAREGLRPRRPETNHAPAVVIIIIIIIVVVVVVEFVSERC